MIRVFLLLLACMAGTWYLVDTIKQNGPGYVLISYNDYTLETSFWFAVLLLIALVALVYGAIRLTVILFMYSIKLGLLPENYSRKRSIKLEAKGTQAFLDQHWTVAGTQLIKAAKNSTTPFLDQVMAARAYLASANIEEAEKCLKQAKTLPDADKLSLSLLELDISTAKNNPHKTNALLHELLKSTSGKASVLARAIPIYSNNQNWDALNKLLPKIRKQQVLVGDALVDLEEKIAIGLMHKSGNKPTVHHLNSVWKSFPNLHNKPSAIYSFCFALHAIGHDSEAEKHLKHQLGKAWNEELIQLYGLIKSKHPEKQLAFLETFLPAKKDNATMQLALAQVALANQLTGQAREYLENSLQIAPSVEAYRLLADINEQLNDANSARHNLKEGLKLAASQLSY